MRPGFCWPSPSHRVALVAPMREVSVVLWHAVHHDGSDPLVEWNMLGRVRQPSAYASAWDRARSSRWPDP
jgi:hypothetical protein